jgi:hypothetical protein
MQVTNYRSWPKPTAGETMHVSAICQVSTFAQRTFHRVLVIQTQACVKKGLQLLTFGISNKVNFICREASFLVDFTLQTQ